MSSLEIQSVHNIPKCVKIGQGMKMMRHDRGKYLNK